MSMDENGRISTEIDGNQHLKPPFRADRYVLSWTWKGSLARCPGP